MNPVIIVITGNPGVGKHTVSKKLAEDIGYTLIDINKVVLQDMDKGSNDYDDDTVQKKEVDDTFDVDTDLIKEKIAKEVSREGKDDDGGSYNRGKKNIIIVGHLAPYVLSKNQVDKVIVLRKSPYDLLKVYKERNYSEKKAKDNAGSEILGVIANDARAEFADAIIQLDTTGKPVQEIIQQIKKSIMIGHKVANKKEEEDSTDKATTEAIDWLSLVAQKNDLRKFFGY